MDTGTRDRGHGYELNTIMDMEIGHGHWATQSGVFFFLVPFRTETMNARMPMVAFKFLDADAQLC